jgi:flagellar basal-body rod protein FlgF
MVNGLYTSASAMAAQDQTLEAIAGNLANLSTPGYKRDVPAFEDVLVDALDVASAEGSSPAAVTPTTSVDLQDGPVRRTDNSFDLALQGPGFLVVKTADGEAYTRNGALSLASDGTLVTENGQAVLGQNGPIRIEGDKFTVSARGEVSVDGNVVGKLRLVGIPADQMRRIGNSLVVSAGETSDLKWTNTEVKQGYLEQSNANAVWEMVSLITAMRVFEANQRLIQAQDQTLEQAVSRVGRV